MKKQKKQKVGNALLRFMQGLLLGSSGILPGVSGGVLCVVFGIYKPLMEVLVSPIQKIKEYWKMLLPLGAGALSGFLIIANVLGKVMEENSTLATCLFLGLIIGTLPALFKTAGGKKNTCSSYVALFISFALVFSGLMCIEYLLDFSVTPSTFWYVGAGIVFGVSIVFPGLSAYTILEVLDLFKPLLAAVQELDFSVLLPTMIGGAAALILLSKLVNMLYDRHFSVMSHIIIGIVVATTIPLIPTAFCTAGNVIVKLLLVAVGFAVATLFAHFDNKFKNEPV